jgi:2,3-bisphosphoglycerate-independent phosphoglycerate mutase
MSKSPHVLLIFLDGFGIGKKDIQWNPFFVAPMDTLRQLLGGTMPHLHNTHYSNSTTSLVPINATLGVDGLPQSGTGQTSLMTGKNAARIIGKHFGPYPYSTLRPILNEHNIFSKVRSVGKQPYYVNAFPRQFFEHTAVAKTRMSAITMSWMMSGGELHDHAILSTGKALSSDITNEHWAKLGYPDIPVISPEEAGHRLVDLSREFDFVLFEYFLTDQIGHSQSMSRALHILERLDGLFKGILDTFDHDSMLCVVTSDHGNLEDLSTKSHTRNPVPLLAFGKHHHDITREAKNLTHVAPAILKILR